MFTFLLVIHAIVAASLVAVILMQRSEGGGLGMGGSPSGLMSARGAADFLTRATTILATVFVVMSIGLATYAGMQRAAHPIDTSLARPAGTPAPGDPVPLGDPLAGAAAAGGNVATPVLPAPAVPVSTPAPVTTAVPATPDVAAKAPPRAARAPAPRAVERESAVPTKLRLPAPATPPTIAPLPAPKADSTPNAPAAAKPAATTPPPAAATPAGGNSAVPLAQ